MKPEADIIQMAERVGGKIEDTGADADITNMSDVVVLKRWAYGRPYNIVIDTSTATATELDEVNLIEMDRKIFGAVLRVIEYELRKNSLTEQIEWRRTSSNDNADWQEFTKESSAVMWQKVKETVRGRKGQSSLSKTDRTELMEGYIDFRGLKTNPFKDWLDSIDKVEPEGSEEDWLALHNPLTGAWSCSRPEGVKEKQWEQYLTKVGFLPFVWAVAHANEKSPPIARLAMVLAGPQEIGKSNYLKASLPNRWAGRWHGEMKIHQNLQEMVTMALGRIFVEVSEGVGLTAKSRDIFKSFMSAAEPAYREVYQAHRTQFQRNWFLYMTSNERRPIPYDTSGYTRYLSVNVNEKAGWRDDTKVKDVCREAVQITGSSSIGDMSSYGTYVASYMTVNRRKIWGIAKYLYDKHGATYLRLTEAETAARSLAVSEVVHTTDIDDRVAAELECSELLDGEPVQACSIIHLARVLNLADMSDRRPPNAKDEHYIERSLIAAGFEKLSADQRIKAKYLQSRREMIDEQGSKDTKRSSVFVWARRDALDPVGAANSYGAASDVYVSSEDEPPKVGQPYVTSEKPF